MDAKTLVAPAAPPYRLDEQVGFVLRQVSQRHSAIFSARIGGDLTAMQWAALVKLDEIGATSQNQLGRATAMDVATIKGVVDRLTKRALITITPDPDDARRRLVTLTPRGRSLVAGKVAAARVVTEETLAPLSAQDRRTLLDLLTRLK